MRLSGPAFTCDSSSSAPPHRVRFCAREPNDEHSNRSKSDQIRSRGVRANRAEQKKKVTGGEEFEMDRTSASRGFWTYKTSEVLQAASKKCSRSLSLNAPSSMAAAAAAGSDSGVRVLGSPPPCLSRYFSTRFGGGRSCGGGRRWGTWPL